MFSAFFVRCEINEIFHPKTKICRKLHFHILFELMILTFFKNVSTSSGIMSGPEMWLRWPVFRAPMASFWGLKSSIQGSEVSILDCKACTLSSMASTLAPEVVLLLLRKDFSSKGSTLT